MNFTKTKRAFKNSLCSFRDVSDCFQSEMKNLRQGKLFKTERLRDTDRWM